MITKRILATITLGVLLASPIAALAAWDPDAAAPETGIGNITDLLNVLMAPVWMIFAFLVVVMFIYAGIMFLTAAGSPDKIAAAKGAALYGVIGAVVGVLSYVIVTVVGTTLTV